MTTGNATRWMVAALMSALTPAVLAAGPPRPGPERLERMFRALDRNDDGRIERDEFVDHAPEARRHMRHGPPPSPEGEFKRSGPAKMEHRINEVVERRVNEILDRRIHEFVKEHLSRIIDERMRGLADRGPMSARGRMGRSRGHDWDRPGPFGHGWDRGRGWDRHGKSEGRAWACQPPGWGQKGPCAGHKGWGAGHKGPGSGHKGRGSGRPKGDWHGTRPDRGREGLRGRGADRRRGGLGPRPLFGMLDADHDGKIQAEEIKRLVDKLQKALGSHKGDVITEKDWNRIVRKRAKPAFGGHKEQPGKGHKERRGHRTTRPHDEQCPKPKKP